ncbi:type I restriction enzyme, R subunit [Enterococcus sp. DIV0724b]|uniref:type I restriction endonuclease subunit R n=1 Tax=Enterococcus sp. DIV0724b TaxID=2774694 RepID=UPI003D2FF693
MVDFITEDDLELRIMEEFEDLGYSLLNAYTKTNSSLKDGTHRQTKKQVVLPDVLLEYARKLNPSIPDALIVGEVQAIIKDDSLNSRLLKDKNYEYYQSLINGVNIKFSLNDEEQIETLKLIDFEHPENNYFIAARQVWIAGEIGYRRPDIIVYINGLPLVWIELKKPSENVQLGYSKNLMDQKKDIPQLFFFNQLCIISNGHITKAGSYNSTFSHYFEWLKIEDEKEVIDRTKIHDEELSIQYLLKGLMPKAKLLDYIENFILYLNKDTKIVAKNHQFLGVNHAIEAFENREARNGKLGVFWHTQGSGKSFSMVMYVRKIRRKFAGNYTFLLVTDRNDLDSQLIKNFVRTGVVEDTNMVKPKSGLQLRELLKSNISMIFTTIQKFRYDKYKDFPLLSERKDIIVIVDEAHRTQYKNLAENMRKGIPNAQYIAFTGTPLLGSKQLTYDYFGNPVSEYTFNDSINDGATVPLFYTKKVPTVNLNNDLLNDEFLDIIDKEELTDEERKKLENKYRSSLNVMKRDDRLDEVAQYIVKHFPKRGFLGKGMVISVDKYATVMMYNKVQEHWKKRIRAINSVLQQTHSQEEKEALLKEKTFMKSVEMAVVVSEESGEEEKFERFGLDITQHRKRYHQVDDEGRDIEEQFKDPDHPLQLVFVTAMWLTGFDAPSVSTLYLDKPMKSHTLMQAIARANRVYSDDKRGIKINGLIVDHVNIFHYMKKALKDYGGSHHEAELDLPVKQVDELVEMLVLTQEEIIHFCTSLNIDLMEIVSTEDVFSKTCKIKSAVNVVLATDEQKAQFIIYTNLLKNIYDASCPEIFQYDWDNRIFKLVQYMSKLMGNLIQNERIEEAQVKVEALLDVSVDSENLFYIKEDSDVDYNNKTISLSELDVETMIAKIQKSEYVNIKLVELRNFIEQKLEAMLNKNETRVSFAQRYEKLVQGYNAGATANENYFEELKKFVKDLKKEDARASTEHLSEEELVLYDLLLKEKLTKEEEKQVKSAATQLYHSLMKENGKFLSVDWFKDEQPKQRVKNKIETVLDKALPDSYDKEVFQNKTETIFQFILNRAVSGRGYVGNL